MKSLKKKVGARGSEVQCGAKHFVKPTRGKVVGTKDGEELEIYGNCLETRFETAREAGGGKKGGEKMGGKKSRRWGHKGGNSGGEEEPNGFSRKGLAHVTSQTSVVLLSDGSYRDTGYKSKLSKGYSNHTGATSKGKPEHP